MARLRQVAMARGALPLPELRGVLVEGPVSDVMQRFHRPVPADEGCELGRVGLFSASGW